MSNADFRPTDQHLEVQKLLAERLRARLGDFDAIAAGDLAAFNQMLRSRNIRTSWLGGSGLPHPEAARPVRPAEAPVEALTPPERTITIYGSYIWIRRRSTLTATTTAA